MEKMEKRTNFVRYVSSEEPACSTRTYSPAFDIVGIRPHQIFWERHTFVNGIRQNEGPERVSPYRRMRLREGSLARGISPVSDPASVCLAISHHAHIELCRLLSKSRMRVERWRNDKRHIRLQG